MRCPFSCSPPVVVFLRFAVIASGCASCPRLVCHREGCRAEFCYHCKQAWHPNQTCDSARQQRAQSLHTHSNHSPSYTQEQGPSECLEDALSVSTLILKKNLVNLIYTSLNDINQPSVVLVTTVVAEFKFADSLKCVYRTVKSPLSPFADIFASLQTFFLHPSLSHQHSHTDQMRLSDWLPVVSAAGWTPQRSSEPPDAKSQL